MLNFQDCMIRTYAGLQCSFLLEGGPLHCLSAHTLQSSFLSKSSLPSGLPIRLYPQRPILATPDSSLHFYSEEPVPCCSHNPSPDHHDDFTDILGNSPWQSFSICSLFLESSACHRSKSEVNSQGQEIKVPTQGSTDHDFRCLTNQSHTHLQVAKEVTPPVYPCRRRRISDTFT